MRMSKLFVSIKPKIFSKITVFCMEEGTGVEEGQVFAILCDRILWATLG